MTVDPISHHHEWIRACKTGEPTSCPFDYSGPLTEAVLLGNVAYRAGQKIDWDSKRLRARNLRSADSFLSSTTTEKGGRSKRLDLEGASSASHNSHDRPAANGGLAGSSPLQIRRLGRLISSLLKAFFPHQFAQLFLLSLAQPVLLTLGPLQFAQLFCVAFLLLALDFAQSFFGADGFLLYRILQAASVRLRKI